MIPGDGARLQVHLPHLGRAALKRWRGPSGGDSIDRAVLAGDGSVASIVATPYRFSLEGDPSGPGLVVVGAADVVIRSPGRSLERATAEFRLAVDLLTRRAGGRLEFTADPRTVAAVIVTPPPDDPEVARTAVDLVAELPPRILGARPILEVRGAPFPAPDVRAEGRSLHLRWAAQRAALSSGAGVVGTPSIGATAAYSVAAAELVPAAAERTAELDGRPYTLRVLDAEDRGGRIWASVRLEDPTRCSWADVDLPVAATLNDSGRLGLRGAGAARLVRTGGALGRSLPSPDALTKAVAEGASGLVDSLGGFRMRGPAGTESRGVLARSGAGAFVLELNLADLGAPTLTPRDLPAQPRPKGR